MSAYAPTLLCVLGFGLASAGAFAQSPEQDPVGDRTAQLLEQAIDAYAQAQDQTERSLRLEGFRRAERLFDGVATTGLENAELYANLGNAALQGERLGPAILAYRRALRLDPGLTRAEQNLAHARTLLPSWVPTPQRVGVLDSFFFWHRVLSRDTRLALASLGILLAGFGAAGAIYWRSSALGWAAAAPAAAWMGLALSVALDPARDASHDGVMTAESAIARAGDSANAPVLFGDPLPSGTEVGIVEDRGQWLQVRLHNGRSAWVAASAVERVAGS